MLIENTNFTENIITPTTIDEKAFVQTCLETTYCDGMNGNYKCEKIAYNTYNGKNYCDECYIKIKSENGIMQ